MDIHSSRPSSSFRSVVTGCCPQCPASNSTGRSEKGTRKAQCGNVLTEEDERISGICVAHEIAQCVHLYPIGLSALLSEGESTNARCLPRRATAPCPCALPRPSSSICPLLCNQIALRTIALKFPGRKGLRGETVPIKAFFISFASFTGPLSSL